MANNLYEEAINAAEQIKDAAESKVKQQLVEAMSPKIKTLIERSLMGEEIDEMNDGPTISSSDISNKDPKDSKDSEDPEDPKDPDDSNECGGQLESDIKDECGIGESNIDELSAEAFYAGGSSLQEVEISAESANILRRMIGEKSKRQAAAEKLQELSESIKSLKKAVIIAESSRKSKKVKTQILQAYKILLSELKNIKSSSIIKSDKTLLKEYLRISKEFNNMSRRRKSRNSYLNENLEDLLEMNIFEDDEDLDDTDDDLEDEELDGDQDDQGQDDQDSEDEMDDMSSGDELWDQAKGMTLEELVTQALSGDTEEEAGDTDEEIELEMDDPYGKGARESVEETFEADPMEGIGEIEEDDIPELASESRRSRNGRDLFLEIDENMLKNEITKMRRLREGEASEMASHFGGGSLDKEMFVDVDDGDLNVHAGELGREDVPMPKVEAALRKTMRNNRMLESKIRQYKNAVRGMKTQLSEMNLFNAKLLYANKLMQNRDLSIKQQRHIVESLDEASTLNEAKLLFESLSKSLSKPARSGRNLTEGSNRRTLGSSSRSVQSGSAKPMNESVALDRWATLAGIK